MSTTLQDHGFSDADVAAIEANGWWLYPFLGKYEDQATYVECLKVESLANIGAEFQNLALLRHECIVGQMFPGLKLRAETLMQLCQREAFVKGANLVEGNDAERPV